MILGEELNGLELQRVMLLKYEGGAAQVEVADLGALHDFPQCPDSTALQQYLGEWFARKLKTKTSGGAGAGGLRGILFSHSSSDALPTTHSPVHTWV